MVACDNEGAFQIHDPGVDRQTDISREKTVQGNGCVTEQVRSKQS